jgi:TolB-like protein
VSLFGELKRRNVFRVGAAYAVVAWIVLQVSDTMVPALRLPDWVQSAVVLLLLLGFPIALLLAWAFELTPDGVKREAEIDRSESAATGGRRPLDYVIFTLLLVIVGIFAYDKFARDPGSETTTEGAATEIEKTIAVLPFVAMSSGEDDGYFADGLTEEILNALAQLPALQVTARTSSFFFKGQNIPIPEIAARLEVAHIVEGSVRRSGEQVRITAQLIRAADGFHLWSRNYDRTLDDIFAAQQDIAENIAAVLEVVLDDAARQAMQGVGIRDVEAFIDYQKGMEAFAAAHEQVEGIAEALVAANVYFDRTLAVATNLADVSILKADLAGQVVFEYSVGLRELVDPAAAVEALEAARAESDSASRAAPPGNQRDILDLERSLFLDSWAQVPAQIEMALAPGECPQLNWTGEFITAYGYAEKVADKYREMLACDPVNFAGNNFLPLSLLWSGDPLAALEEVDRAKSIGISHPWLDDGYFLALLAAGRTDDPAARVPQPASSSMMFDRSMLYEALVGDPSRALEIADEYLARPAVDAWSSLIVAAVVGKREKANELAATIDSRPGGALALSSAVFNCFCGAPFDLDAVPNFKARVEEAGFSWPPEKPIDYPTKTW